MRSAESGKDTAQHDRGVGQNSKNGVDIASDVSKVPKSSSKAWARTTDLVSEISGGFARQQAQGIDQ